MSLNREMGFCRRVAIRKDALDAMPVSGDASSILIRSIISWFLAILLAGFAGSAWAQSISDSPNSRITVIQGNTATSTITASGFGSSTFISFSIAGLPSGTTASFSPPNRTGNGSTTLTLTVGASTPAGDHSMTVTATYISGSVRTRTTTVQIRVVAPDFTMSLSQATVRITQGGANSTTTITTTASAGFNADIAFAISGLPTGVTATFIPDTVAAPGSGSSILRLDVDPATTAGNYPLTITGTGGGKTKTVNLTLTVNAATGGWNSFNYIFDSPDDVYTNGCTNSYPAAENCNLRYPWDTDWRMRAAAVNVLYYDPANVYSPWPGLSNASFTAVRSNPQPGQTGYDSIRDLTGLVYEVAVDDSGFSGDRPRRGTNSNKTTGANGLIDLWDTHKRYTVNANSITVATYTYNNITSTSLNPAISTDTLSDASTCYPELGGGDVSCRTIAQAQENIANWYQYYRRRSFVAKSAISNVITGSPYYRYGLSVINSSGSLFQEMPTATPYSTHNSTLLGALYDYIWAAQGTPLQSGLNLAGRYYRGTLTGRTSPINSTCQQNFSVLLTDGYWNGAAPSGIGDADSDGFSVTLADVARYYYTTDLSGLANNVPINTFDTANWQHMVTFGVSFGIQGDLIDTDGDGWPNPVLSESDSWGNPTSCSDCPEKVDDIWHAAYNSRGTFVAAQTPTDVEKALSDALAGIGGRLASSAAIATNSTRLDTDTLIYQAQFNSGDWSGRLLAFQIGSDGTIRDPDNDGNLVEDAYWDSDNPGTFASHGSRRIYTWTGDMSGTPPTPTANAGVVFNTLSALSSSQQAALVDQDHLDWIRGDQSNEQASGGTFRNRSYLLGDIVNSNPAYVAVTNFGFENLPSGAPGQSSYVAFRNANRSRTPMLYVGANDGMLHAFNASTGVEQFAFIPKAVFPNLANLANPSYTHKYFVDGSSLAGDAYIDGAWKTILVGSTGAGGRSIFALDVTNPGSFDQTKVLWEFTDADLGYPIGQFVQPVIGRMQNGEWAVVFGNGYESGNRKAFLYVVNLATGALIKKIDTGAGSAGSPNGLAGPVLLADDNQTIKYAYAGDLLGNLWKFDLSSANTSGWDVAFKAGTTPKPLFQARYVSGSTEIVEPITSPPEIGLHPDSGYLIFFGTGKFFETGDNLTNTVQSLYGIWDKDDGNSACVSSSDSCIYPTNRSTLQQQTILAATSANGNNWRVVSNNSIDWNSKRGWYIDLISGERSVSVPLLRHGRAIFTTIIPSTDICSGGGTSWIMEVDMRSGGRISDSVFDVNKDAKFDTSDNLTVAGIGTVPVSGIQSKVGIINTPSVISAGSIEYKYAAGSSGGIMDIPEKGSESAGGRQSWRQLR